MPPTSDVELDDGEEGRAGLNRRQMIKAAGIAGAAAWTAPMIIDSLSSPAAAATVTPGCYAILAPLQHLQPDRHRSNRWCVHADTGWYLHLNQCERRPPVQ